VSDIEGARIADYALVADLLEGLPELVRSERQRRGIGHRQAAPEMGYTYADLCRFEQGEKIPRLDAAVRMLRWLAESKEQG
jgi:ribosome-binding protein aMBF1 (putative translation factor)